MAFLGYSDDFDLDDDGILRDSASSGGILIDDDGIVRDDFDAQSKYTSRSSTTHWTDSGLGGDKQSGGSTSTIRQFDLQSYPSYEALEDSHVNISDLEASKDDLSFEGDAFRNSFDRDIGYDNGNIRSPPSKHQSDLQSGLSSRSSFDHSLTFDDTNDNFKSTTDSGNKELFDSDYYKQLEELGVLIDGAELAEPLASLDEFEILEDHVSREDIDYSADEDNDLDNFIKKTPIRSPGIGGFHGDKADNREEYEPPEERQTHTRPNTASSARTISDRSFPEISPEEALKYYNERVSDPDQEIDFGVRDADSIDFEESQRTGDDDEIFDITSRISDAPKPAKRRAFGERDTPSMLTPSFGSRSGSRLSHEGSRSNTPGDKKGHLVRRPNSRGSDRSFDHNDSFMSNSSKGQQYQNNQLHRHSGPREDRSFDHNDSFLSTHSYASRTSRDGSLTPVSTGVFSESHMDARPGSLTPRNTSQSEITRPDSVASQRSAASEQLSARSRQRSSHNTSREDNPSLSKARSQESFFHDSELQPVRSTEKSTPDKMPKRLLPKPNSNEVSQSYRVKSKSTTNIAAKTGPVKPKHMSVSDLSRVQLDEHESEGQNSTSDKSKNELSSKLNQEFHKRKQATELVQQLQKDYDKLLSKYASAELTIDQLRLGARVTLHSNSPTPSQATSGSLQSLQQPQVMQLNRGMKSPSPFQGSLGYASPMSVDSTAADSYNDQGQGSRNKFRSQSESALTNGNAEQEARNMALSSENGAESVKLGLIFQANGLDDRMESFKTLLDEQQLTHDEQEKVFEKIRTDHEKLRRDYLQSKEDYNVLKRANANVGDVNFDQEKELEGELFRLGMKFDEIHEKVDENRQKKSSERQPFQSNRSQSNGDISLDGSDAEGRAIDHTKKKVLGVMAGDDLVKPQKDQKFQDTVNRLHVEYSNLMDRYRRLKQMAQTPERDREIDNLVKKLKHICNSEPEIFKMPKELQESQDHEISIASDVSQTGSDLDDEPPRWEQLQERDENGRRMSVASPIMGRRPSQQVQQREQMASVQNHSFTRGRETPTSSHNWSMDRSYSEYNGDTPRGLPRDNNLQQSSSISSSRSSLCSRGTPQDPDRNSPNPRLPRPRRHDHPDRKHGLKKRPEGGSLSSLGDSGISEHDNTNGGGATAGNLSSLPGPGKFKQMTKQRNAPDADSGFIGSMVGSEVSQMSSRQQQLQQQDQGQPSLRLRHPADNEERPRSRTRDIETASVSSSRSARSGRSRQDDRPSSRGSLRSGSRRDMTTDMSRDFTDDSYTLTESDMSFDSSQVSRRSRQRPRSMVEASIQEEEEGRPPATPRQTKQKSRVEPHQPIIRTPGKPHKSKAADVSRSSLNISGEHLTPRATPNVSFNESQDVFLSGEDTPRQENQEVYKEEPKIEAQKPATVTRQPQKHRRPQTPPAAKVERPSTPRAKGREVSRGNQGYVKTQERPKEETKPKLMEDRSVGSDSDDTLEGSEAATVATKASEGSEKFRLLQDEIGRLRDEFQKATEQQRQQMIQQQQQQQQHIPPPPPQPQQQQQQDDYHFFDPTEDAYAFMRGPRRRANSFSGAGVRDWDDWWKYPLNNPNDGAEIPLGYAAADSYATPRRQAAAAAAATAAAMETGQEARPRGRHRIRKKYRKTTSENAAQTQAGYDSDQSPTRATASTVTDDQLYNYYVPRYQHPTQMAATPQQTPQRAARYSSQPNLYYAAYPTASTQPQVYAAPPQPAQQYTPRTANYATPISAGYGPRSRQPSQYRLPSSPQQQRTYSYDDIDVQGQGQTYQQAPVAYILTDQVPAASEPVYQTDVDSAVCPLCGGVGYHTHTEQEAPPQGATPTVVYTLPQPVRRSRPRQRSKSATRVRHYSPEGRRRSRYLVREYRSESESAESDDEVYLRRSRSSDRRRRRPARRYRKEYEDALNQSLNLTEEIDDLTTKMMSTVRGELKRAKKHKDFGSSVW
ncbi:microtubule-associated protein futsch-like isoform X2 [Argopecten irradians]|uniref:microtubule-associated protein futsch-like isoform X2 n=1 Tax=Argopecten irradians TaxID=31199 RepID=UPI0037223EEA